MTKVQETGLLRETVGVHSAAFGGQGEKLLATHHLSGTLKVRLRFGQQRVVQIEQGDLDFDSTFQPLLGLFCVFQLETHLPHSRHLFGRFQRERLVLSTQNLLGSSLLLLGFHSRFSLIISWIFVFDVLKR